jgi:hypothetical protein
MQPKSPRTLWFLLFLVPAAVLAQQSGTPASAPTPVHDLPPPAELEPGVNTSAPAPSAEGPVSQSTDSGRKDAGPQGAAQAATAAKGAPAAGASRKDAAPRSVPKKTGPDRLQLDATDITGNRELPKVLYIVPWKRSDLGDLLGKPPNSLLDDVLQPVDRDVFRRENRYYDALKPEAESAPPPASAGGQKNP